MAGIKKAKDFFVTSDTCRKKSAQPMPLFVVF